MDPYKNVHGLVEAFAQARRRVAFPLRLVVCGPPDDRYPEARLAAQRLGVADDVRFTGFVSDEELARLYATADLLVHPSRYEGFGLQLVEAMKCGLPVCCTDGGSQPEIAGDAAVVVKAGDSLAMAEAVADILGDPAKQERMKAAGLARARNFEWNVCAERTAAIYRTLVKP
jgi:glycosyltransferase involved in cell wall biosynthesis